VDQPSITLLAVTSSYTNSPIDSRFFGPLTVEDVASLPQFVEILLIQDHKKKLPKHGAEALVHSMNPWLIELGLWRLRAEKRLIAKNFITAMTVRSPADTREVLNEMFNSAFMSRFSSQDMTSTVAEMIQLPDRQLIVLQTLNDWLPNDDCGVRSYLDISFLQDSARKYRDQVLAEGRDPDLVAQLERLLAFRIGH
jgi:hypothetical protein